MRLFAPFLLALGACTGPETTDSGNDTDTDGGAETDVEPACTELPSGRYEVSGPCFGMRMSVELSMDVDACAFVLSDWSMNHGGEPEGGAVTGTDVALEGGGWDGCTGSIDGDAMSGTCPDGCAWEIAFDE